LGRIRDGMKRYIGGVAEYIYIYIYIRLHFACVSAVAWRVGGLGLDAVRGRDLSSFYPSKAWDVHLRDEVDAD
jgi:hypothetical protein